MMVLLIVDDHPRLIRTKPLAASRNPGETTEGVESDPLGFIRKISAWTETSNSRFRRRGAPGGDRGLGAG